MPEMKLPYREERPWGWFIQYTHNDPKLGTIKMIGVNKGARNSLQRHKMRDEEWIIIAGSMEITRNGTVEVGKEGDRFEVPHGTAHRFKGLSEDNRLLEISFGNFDENDNERLEDDYGRA